MRKPFNGSYALSQGFGENPADYARFGMIGHNGDDFALPTGTPVLAAHDGTVQNLEDPNGFGHYVQIIGSEYKTVYGHLQKFLQPSGASVKEGDVIALSNNTGNSTGPHLHFGVKPIHPDNNNGYFGAIDPAPLFKEEGMSASQDLCDPVTVQLAYQGVLERTPDQHEIDMRAGKQTEEQLLRDLNTSDEKRKLIASRSQPDGFGSAIKAAIDVIVNYVKGK